MPRATAEQSAKGRSGFGKDGRLAIAVQLAKSINTDTAVQNLLVREVRPTSAPAVNPAPGLPGNELRTFGAIV